MTVSVVGLPSPNDFRKNPLSHFARPSKSCLRNTTTKKLVEHKKKLEHKHKNKLVEHKHKNNVFDIDDDDEMTETEFCSSTFTFSTTREKKENEENDELAATSTTSKSKSKQMVVVSFDSIEIREFPIILGDNPSPKTGVPITIGWKVQRRGIFNIDHYEEANNGTISNDNDDNHNVGNGHGRFGKDLMIPSKDRTQLAILGGASLQEIGQMAVAIAKIQKQRAQSSKDSNDKKGRLSSTLRSVFSSSSSTSLSSASSRRSNAANNNNNNNNKKKNSTFSFVLHKNVVSSRNEDNNNGDDDDDCHGSTTSTSCCTRREQEQHTTFTNAAA